MDEPLGAGSTTEDDFGASRVRIFTRGSGCLIPPLAYSLIPKGSPYRDPLKGALTGALSNS